MQDYLGFYINGEWVTPDGRDTIDIVNPADETVFARISAGTAEDVDQAVAAARAAFERFSQSTVEDRVALLQRIVDIYKRRMGEMGEAISREMGAPLGFATKAQAGSGLAHFSTMLKLVGNYDWQRNEGDFVLTREPIGVCGLITPWNWPQNQIACKVAPALAAGCTMVLKPSEIAPIDAMLLAEILDEAGVPAGVFNLVNGDGPTVGAAMSSHPDIDMMSFTGSTRAGIQVAKSAADSVKRVAQELGGKSPNVILDDADLEKAVVSGARQVFANTGQSCNAPTRMLVPAAQMKAAAEIAAGVANATPVGDPTDPASKVGPVVSKAQFDKIQGLIRTAIDEGATLVAGGPGRPAGMTSGFYVRPTVFANVSNAMHIAREEVFGPVLVIIGYDDEDEAVAIANDTPYGLAAYVQSGDPQRAVRVASRLRAGSVHINGHGGAITAPFGGYKQSGNGREWGEFGLEEFLETKAIFVPKQA
ncbi:MAG: aldehyde dehydrogenase family protein [Pseudomonadota bacterium]